MIIASDIDISIIICSYNRAAYIPLALGALVQQTLAAHKFETIIVDNNSTDNTEVVCAQFIKQHATHRIIYLTETNQGSSFARNTGAKIAKGKWLIFLDDDAIADLNFLEEVHEFMQNTKSSVALGGRIIPRYLPAEPKWMSHHVSSLVGNFNYAEIVTEFAADKYPLESNMIVCKADFEAINGFNVNLPGVKGTLRIGGEGKDFFIRLKQLGVKVYYSPNVIVEHITEVSKLTREYMYRVASGIGRGEAVRTKNLGKWNYIKKIIEYMYKLAGSIVLGLLYALKGKPAQFWPVVNFRIDALKGLLGK